MRRQIIAFIALILIGFSIFLLSEQQDNTNAIPYYINHDWDSVCVFTPYTPKKQIEDKVNSLSGDNFIAQEMNSDAVYLFVFFKGHKISKTIYHHRKFGDVLTNESLCFRKSDTHLHIFTS